jgi:hypothetical protein
MSSKLREALSDACYAMFNFLKTQYGNRYEEMAKALDKAKATLATEPLRNCDVGTAEEQAERANNYCAQFDEVDGCCVRCPLDDDSNDYTRCMCRWLQMPYKEVKNAANS